MGRAKMREPLKALEEELIARVHYDRVTEAKGLRFAEEVKSVWVQIWDSMSISKSGPGHPFETGKYRSSIKVRKLLVSQGRIPKGQPGGGQFTSAVVHRFWVGTKDGKAHFIEFGTGVDTKGTGRWQDLRGKWHKSKLTPTPTFAPATQTAAVFHGTGPD